MNNSYTNVFRGIFSESLEVIDLSMYGKDDNGVQTTYTPTAILGALYNDAKDIFLDASIDVNNNLIIIPNSVLGETMFTQYTY